MTTPKPLDLTKPLRQRCGRDVRNVRITSVRHKFPIMYENQDKHGDWWITSCFLSGVTGEIKQDHDLINAPTGAYCEGYEPPQEAAQPRASDGQLTAEDVMDGFAESGAWDRLLEKNKGKSAGEIYEEFYKVGFRDGRETFSQRTPFIPEPPAPESQLDADAKERGAFEKWMSKYPDPVNKYGNGDYKDEIVSAYWDCWKAAWLERKRE